MEALKRVYINPRFSGYVGITKKEVKEERGKIIKAFETFSQNLLFPVLSDRQSETSPLGYETDYVKGEFRIIPVLEETFERKISELSCLISRLSEADIVLVSKNTIDGIIRFMGDDYEIYDNPTRIKYGLCRDLQECEMIYLIAKANDLAVYVYDDKYNFIEG